MRAAELAADHGCWNAAGLLLVHGAIAYTDAVCISRAGIKSTSDSHMDAVALLGEASKDLRGQDEALGHLERLIREKSRVAYTGQSFRAKDVEALRKHAERFCAWPERILSA